MDRRLSESARPCSNNGIQQRLKRPSPAEQVGLSSDLGGGKWGGRQVTQSVEALLANWQGAAWLPKI
ncbi:MAG: hypothetical protein ACFB8W_25250 [Elainellaceae cyanobacterium]